MNTLSLHIEYLLLRRDCVVVPGIGAFINVRHSAFFDASIQAWHPMTREVRFNRALTHDDGLLANSYARKNQISFEDGREMLRGDIAEIQRALNAGDSVAVGCLGTLRMENDTLRFVPSHSAEELSSIYGYEPAPIAGPQLQAASADNADGDTAASTEPITDAGGRKFDTNRNYYIAVNKVFARVAACVTAVLLVGLSAMIPVSDCNRADQASVVPVEKIIRATARHITGPVVKVEPKAAADTVRSESEQEQALKYHAVVATFNTAEEAERYIEQNAGCGYRLTVLSTHTKSRVSAIGSNSRETLQKTIISPEFRQKFSESWIWENPKE